MTRCLRNLRPPLSRSSCCERVLRASSARRLGCVHAHHDAQHRSPLGTRPGQHSGGSMPPLIPGGPPHGALDPSTQWHDHGDGYQNILHGGSVGGGSANSRAHAGAGRILGHCRATHPNLDYLCNAGLAQRQPHFLPSQGTPRHPPSGATGGPPARGPATKPAPSDTPADWHP